MFDLKVINSVLVEMEEERGISREKMMDAIEQSLFDIIQTVSPGRCSTVL